MRDALGMQFVCGLLLGFFAGLKLMLVLDDAQHENPHSIERQARAVYEQRAASLDWYEGARHLEPWSKLTEEEREAWRRPLRKYERK